MGKIGVGLFWITFSLVLFWIQPYPETILGLGTAMAHMAIPVIIAVGGHELAHYLKARMFFEEDEVAFVTFQETVTAAKIAIAFLLLVIGLHVFEVVTLPWWVVLFAAASPGAVLIEGAENIREYSPWIAVVGPLFNFVVGAYLYFYVFDSQFVLLPPTEPQLDVVLSIMMVVNIFLAFLNALPFHPLDGGKAREHAVTWVITMTIVVVTFVIIFGPHLGISF